MSVFVWVVVGVLILPACVEDKAPTVERSKEQAQPGQLGTESDVATAGTGPSEVEPDSEPTLQFLERLVGGGGAQRRPLVVGIHGLGDSPDRFVRLFDELPVPVRVVIPRGPMKHGRGWSWFSGLPSDADTTQMVADIRSSAERLSRLLVRLRESSNVCGEPIVVGFSQGGVLALTLATHHPESVGAVVLAAGWLPPVLWPATAAGELPSVVALHGRDDPLLPLVETRGGINHLRDLGFEVIWREYDAGHALSPQMKLDLRRAITGAASRACTSYPKSRPTREGRAVRKPGGFQ